MNKKADCFLELQLDLTAKERARLSQKVEGLSDAPFLVAAEPQPATGPDFQHAIALDPILPSLLVLATNIGDLVSIVKVLLEIARQRKTGRQEIDIKMGTDSFRIRSPVPVNATVDFIEKRATVVSKNQATFEIEQIKMRQLNKDIKATRQSIEMYEKFVHDFPKGRDLNQPRVAKLKEAEKRLDEYRRKLRKLEQQKLSLV